MGNDSFGQLCLEKNFQFIMSNCMDSNETLCILLQHLQSDPGSLTERSTIDLILKSLRWLGLGVAAINNQRVDKKLFSLVILKT